jgi:pimeloyl-ACP methyl ester carboxylesterase
VTTPTVTEGAFSTGVPYLRLGDGPPLLVASGMTAEHENPTGMWRRQSVRWCAPFAEHFTIYLANRRPGLPPGTTMADLAADYAGAIEGDLGAPAFVHGTSTGGSVGLQLAIDHPHLVRRLVVAAAACRLSPEGRKVQADLIRFTQAGDRRRAAMGLVSAGVSPRLRPPAAAMGWLLGRSIVVDDPADMLATAIAEDTFDAEPRLHQITAPTLVLGGSADGFYSADLFERTAAGIPDGRAVVFPGKSHVHVAASKEASRLALGFLLG